MRQVFRVRGMDCAHEVALLRGALEPLEGVEDLGFDLVHARMTVSGAAERGAIEAAVKRTGLQAEPWDQPQRNERNVLGLTTMVSGAALLAGVVSRFNDGPEAPFATIAVLAGIWHVLPRAWLALRRMQPDMHLLMTVAIAGAIAIGEWTEAASVAFLYSLSLALEAWSVGRARRAVESLLDLAPATALLLTEAGEETVPATQVAPGSRILVRPGERVGLDGIVLSGASHLDQSPITGESLPVAKGEGDEVWAGTINGEGALEVETTRDASDTTVARMVRMVEEAGSRRGASERWVERFARVYTPTVMVAALLVLAVPPLLAGADWGTWIYRSLVLLVIACPCALVISTPVSIVAGLTAAARRGVLIKGGQFLELPSQLGAIAFDKTGTLTRGEPRVVEVVALNDHTEEEVLSRAAAVDARSDHVLARAIVDEARKRDVTVPTAHEVRIHGGRGAEGVVLGARYWVGSHRWLQELRADESATADKLRQLAGPGRSVLFVGSERHVCGLIAIADEIREDAREQIAALHAEGVEAIAMLTGDNRPTADAIARATGIDEVEAELLPEQKVEAVERLAKRHGKVAMVGDGINDTPAMARSDLGIAMGAAGSDAALETADIALMTDDLSRLPWLVRHSRRTLGIIRANIFAALLVKAAFVLLTIFGSASLWAAITADMGVSLVVVFNALRLLR